MRCQFVLDPRTNRLLDELAVARAGNRSYVVREAIQLYAAMESALEEVEAAPAFLELLQRTGADIRAGRTYAHDAVKRRLTNSKRKQ